MYCKNNSEEVKSNSLKNVLRPLDAWSLILIFISLIFLLIAIKFSAILQYLFPSLSLIVGIFLFSKYPPYYLSFTMWIWFLSPLVSRIVEQQNGWVDPKFRLIILAPYLVTMVSSITFISYAPKSAKKDAFPYILALSGLVYALLIGTVRGFSMMNVIERFLSWCPGIFLGIHILATYHLFPEYKKNISNTFSWAVLVMGTYGIIQYLTPLQWDYFWLSNAENLQSCCGWPDPWSIRVWSTLNFPFTFAYSMIACLLVLFERRGNQTFLSLSVGIVAFLLSRVRGAWIGYTVGLLTIFTTAKQSQQLRLISTILVLILSLYPIVTATPLSDSVMSRLQTLTNASEDNSLAIRSQIYQDLLDEILPNLVGRGMGSPKIIDAGLLDFLGTLGWIGAMPVAIGILLIFYTVFYKANAGFDSFIGTSRAISLGIFITIPFNNPLLLLPGTLFWTFAAFAMAGQKYYENRCLLQPTEQLNNRIRNNQREEY